MTQPSTEKLTDYLLGKLSESDHGEVTRFLEVNPDFVFSVPGVVDSQDLLVRAIRNSNLEFFDEAGLILGLKKTMTMNWVDYASPLLPKDFGDYRLEICLSENSHATTYKAWDNKSGIPIAVKFFTSQSNPWKLQQWFMAEIQTLKCLKHEQIPVVLNDGFLEERYFYTMEWLEGSDLGELVDCLGPLPIADACCIISQTACALDFCHSKNVIHRDVKPSNLFLTRGGLVKILDFGLAQNRTSNTFQESLPASAAFLGTLDYLSPEQAISSENIDQRTDIYGLGCTFFKLLTGNTPYGNSEFKHPIQKIIAHAQYPIPDILTIRQDCPLALAEVIKNMLGKSPGDRTFSLAQIQMRLSEFAKNADLGLLFKKDYVRQNDFVLPTVSPGPLKHPAIRTYLSSNPKKTFFFPVLLLALFLPGLYLWTVYQSSHPKTTLPSKNLEWSNSQSGLEFSKISFESEPRGHLWDASLDGAEKNIYLAFNDGSLRKIDLISKELIWSSSKSRHGEDSPAHVLKLFSDEKRILSGGTPNWLAIFSSEDGSLVWENFNHTEKITCLDISRDGKRAISAGWDSSVRIWDLVAKKELQHPKSDKNKLFSVGIFQDNKRFFTASSELKIWNLDGPVLLDTAREIPREQFIYSRYLHFQEKDYLFTCCMDGAILAHEIRKNTLKMVMEWKPPPDRYSFGYLNAIGDWETGTIKLLLLPFPTSKLMEKDNEPKSFYLATLKDFKQVSFKEYKGHQRLPTSAIFTKDGKKIITTSLDKTCRFWHVPD